MMNADLGEAMIHRPLFPGRCVLHLLLDLVEQCIEVEALGLLDDSFGYQAPTCPTDEVVAVLPARTEVLGMPTGLHRIHDEPVEEFGGADIADHRIELGRGE